MQGSQLLGGIGGWRLGSMRDIRPRVSPNPSSVRGTRGLGNTRSSWQLANRRDAQGLSINRIAQRLTGLKLGSVRGTQGLINSRCTLWLASRRGALRLSTNRTAKRLAGGHAARRLGILGAQRLPISHNARHQPLARPSQLTGHRRASLFGRLPTAAPASSESASNPVRHTVLNSLISGTVRYPVTAT
ncbi:hypothetical protein ABH920_001792 [Catenulispora sp. EB89]|uniref:hypothetical protein n=1 Tax=Catenulispora sp. EB89 TaxID=3156257 RepID=UPI003511CDC1